MAIQFSSFVFTALLGSVLATSGMQGKAVRVAAAQTPEQAVQPQNPDETEEEKAKKAKKKQQQELQEQKEKQEKQEKQRQEQLQKQREQEAQKPQPQPQPPKATKAPPPPQQKPKQPQEQQEQQLQQKRVSQQEQQERIRKQEQELALYRKNIALREELAERNAQILRQQKRIQHLRFQEQYEARLRAQRAQLMQARYDYTNDPFYYTAPNYRYRRDGRYYQTNQYGMKKLEKALQAGYNEGFHAGRADREDRWRYDYRSAFAYQDANYGYDGRYIAQDEYNHYFREGFQRGYEDGYYDRQEYGRKSDSGINDEWLIAGAVVAAIIGYQVLTD